LIAGKVFEIFNLRLSARELFMNFETRFSFVRWGLTASILIFIFADYSALQAYLLRNHQSSAEYIQFGWNNWYLTLLSAIFLAASVNWLLYKLKKNFGAEKALRSSAPFLFLFPLFLVFSRNISLGSSNGFLNYQLLIVLIVTVMIHFYLGFYKRKTAV
jgi:hypothetical protein